MPIQLISSCLVDTPVAWRSDWAWGLPLIVLTVLIHVIGLATIRQMTFQTSGRFIQSHPTAGFVVSVSTATLLATCLHAVEAIIWALAYQFLGAIPGHRMAMLYSLNAITSYGHTNLRLEDHWHLMGALEALNGWLLFGLTAAFLFAMFMKVWSLGHRQPSVFANDAPNLKTPWA